MSFARPEWAYVRVSRTPRIRDRRRSRGQSLVEFALVVPILLLVFAAAADLGRAFYAYVAIENGVKEGAFFGSRAPLCTDDAAAGCTNPRNVEWRVQNELESLRNPDGTQLIPTVECLDQASGAAHANMTDCAAGDMYVVTLTYPFKFLTPILGDILGGTLNLSADSSAVVLNLAFDPTPGASVQKLVRVANAVNGAAIVSSCLEPDEFDSAGYYRSPCHDTTTADPADTISATFESGVSIQYKVTVGNSGGQPLTGVTVVDSTGATGCTFPTTWAVGYSNQPSPGCTYTRTAPNVPNGQPTLDYANVLTVDSAETNPEQDSVTVTVQPPPPNWKVDVYVSPFALGDDGDGTNGTADFKNVTTVTQGVNAILTDESVWFQIVAKNIGGSTATGVTIASTLGPLPFGQNTANAACDPAPATLAAGATFTCRYKVDAGSAGTIQNTVTANAPNAVPPGRSNVASATSTTCANPSRLIPNLIGLQKAAAQAAWTAAGFPAGGLSVWNGQPNAVTVDPDAPGLPVRGDHNHHDDRTVIAMRFGRPSHRASERGQSLVEFALVLPMFAILLFGIIDFGRFVFTANSMNNGAREAARFASVANRPAECASLSRGACATAIAQSHAWGVPGSSVTVTVTCERYSAGGTKSNPGIANCRTDDLLLVKTQTEFTLVTPLIAQLLGDQTITGESRVAVNQ